MSLKNKLYLVGAFLACTMTSLNAMQVQPDFKCHHGGEQGRGGEVARAGLLLIKEYGPNDYAVLVGEDRHSHVRCKQNGGISLWNFPGGKCDFKKDTNSAETAQRETEEEFHIIIPVTPHKTPYLYPIGDLTKAVLSNSSLCAMIV
ncbi:NUDIX domain-containing protein [Candidatus Odyssella thessalonicensis]|uniref:NUDIX domain-containing protein n=1 Tax=Candidatus Odyssella thessalonicensis TaxID=84647 RepID=UPI000225AF2A|nr:NUDIX hydrolase [Candidatus Odyssella thessalonicensis]